MIGILLILFFIIGFIVYIWLIWLPIRWAKKRGFSWRKQLYIGIAGFFVVSAVFFGKNLISYAAFKYYCKNEAGLTIYKTLEQWKKENPGVWETLKQIDDGQEYQGKTKYPDVPYERIFDNTKYISSSGNQRIILYDKTDYIFWGALEVYSFILMDNKTQEILAKYKYFHWKNTWDTTPDKDGWRGGSYLGEKICDPEDEKFFKYARSFSNLSLTKEEN